MFLSQTTLLKQQSITIIIFTLPRSSPFHQTPIFSPFSCFYHPIKPRIILFILPQLKKWRLLPISPTLHPPPLLPALDLPPSYQDPPSTSKVLTPSFLLLPIFPFVITHNTDLPFCKYTYINLTGACLLSLYSLLLAIKLILQFMLVLT